MLSSLRVRLPLVFLGGILLAVIVTTLIAVQLFREFSRAQTWSQLRVEAKGIAALYTNAVNEAFAVSQRSNSRKAPTFARKNLETATGDLIYYAGVNLFPGEKSGLRPLPVKTIDWTSGKSLTFEFVPPGLGSRYLAVAAPVFVHKTAVGAIVVAKRETSINQRVLQLVERLAIAAALGLLVAGALAFYLSRRLVRPVLALSRAAATTWPSRRARPARSATSPSGSRRWPTGSPRRSGWSGTSSCRSRTSC